MSTAFERFASAEDRLSSLLRALPVFEAPEHMTEAFMRAARQAQSEFVGDSAAAPFFEPPPAMEASFLREVHRIQADQAPREQAVLAQIAAGRSAESVLGGRVTAETAKWLEARQTAKALEQPKTPALATKRRPWHWLSLRDLGLAASALVVTVIAGQWLLRDNATAPAQNVALSPSPTLPGSSNQLTEAAPAPAAAPAISSKLAAAEKPTAAPSKSHSASAMLARQAPGEARLSMPKQKSPGVGIAADQLKEEATFAAAPTAIAQAEQAINAQTAYRDAEVASTVAKGRAEPELAKKSAAAIRADTVDVAKEAAPSMERRRAAATLSTARLAAAAPAAAPQTIAPAPPAPIHSAAKAFPTAPAAEHSGAIASRPVPTTNKLAFRLSDDPSIVSKQLGGLADGIGIHVRSASPPPEGLQDWLAKLRRNLPTGTKLETEYSESIHGESLEIEILPY